MSIHDRGRNAPGKRWEVRWRDSGGVQRKRRHATKEAAIADDARHRLDPGEAVARGTLAQAWETFAPIKRTQVRPSTWHSYDVAWRVHIEPEFGLSRPSSVTARRVEGWAAGISSVSARRRAIVVLRMLLAHCGVALPIRAPRSVRAEGVRLSQDRVAAIAAACHPHEDVVWMLAATGMRFGEAAGLRVGDVDAKRRRVRIARTLSTVGGKLVEGPPKSGKPRTVPVPAWLLARLDLDRPASAPLLPTQRGNSWRHSSWKRVWTRAREVTPAIRPWPRVHDLRHAAAARAIEQGMDLRTLQRMLGHASLTMTVDLYGHLAGDQLDEFEGLWDDPSAPDAPPGQDQSAVTRDDASTGGHS